MPRRPTISIFGPIAGRNLPYMIRVPKKFSETGKILRLFFSTKKDARAEKARRDEDVWENGRMGQLSNKDKASLAFVKDIGLSPAELLEAAQIYKNTPKLDEKAINLSRLSTIFLDHHKDVKRSGIRYQASLKYRLNSFTAKHGAVLSNGVTPSRILGYLEAISNPTTRRSHHQSLSALFNFAMERGYASMSPLRTPGRIIKPPRIEYRVPEILSVQEAESMLEASAGEMRAFLALGCFAGIRSGEMIPLAESKPVLEWEDVRWDRGEIHVRREVAKKTRKRDNERWVPITPALREWLYPLRKPEGRIVMIWHKAFGDWLKILSHVAGLPSWPANGPRHSFASYFLAAYPEKGAAALAQVMGNSETVARQHYVRALNQERGLAYFALRPVDQPAATPQMEERS